jgi:hypothetical protein
MIHAYGVKQTDSFSEHLFPDVVKELEGLRLRSSEIRNPYKTDIIISFLKDHSIKTEWIPTNKEISKLMTSGSLTISHLESLFGSCKHNVIFLNGFEAYIKSRLS